jgi:uncharacterized protein (DUF2252 family)
MTSMEFLTATQSYERWLAKQTTLVRPDLKHKHEAMAGDLFSFFRATFYRWAQHFDQLDGAITKAPEVLSVGDLHLENFGTWRDTWGRLAWGINDFDEAHPLPYTNDLIRLVASVQVVNAQQRLRIRSASRIILNGYREGLLKGGRPFVIGEEHEWFKPIAEHIIRDPRKFWERLRRLPKQRTIPDAARAAIKRLLPVPDLEFEVHRRLAGLGSLGKQRFTGLAEWEGGPMAREAKAVIPSAVAWARDKRGKPHVKEILKQAIRAVDPLLQVFGPWQVRRLAPECRRIELNSLTQVKDKELVLHSMGFETANVHLGTPGAAKRILAHLDRQQRGWLKSTAAAMRVLLAADFAEWRTR